MEQKLSNVSKPKEGKIKILVGRNNPVAAGYIKKGTRALCNVLLSNPCDEFLIYMRIILFTQSSFRCQRIVRPKSKIMYTILNSLNIASK